ncbi:MAG: Lrp/AsnC family transcriptional regulator [Candidatus Methanofastidiosia archaeon]
MQKYTIDDTDKVILRELLKDSHTPVRNLASKANVAIGTIVNRIRQLEENGIIKNYKISIDYEKLGYDIVVITTMKIARGKYPKIAEKLRDEKNIISIYDITGEYDAILISVFHNRSELDHFLKRLQSHPLVEKTHTVLVLNTTKESETNII